MKHKLWHHFLQVQYLTLILILMLGAYPRTSEAQSELEVTVAPNKTQYSPGERVTISGTVLDQFTQPVPDAAVSIQVTNPLGGIVRIELEFTNSSGSFTDKFTLGGKAPSGTYMVNVTASKDNSFGDGACTFEVIVGAPDFKIILEPQSQNITQGEIAQITVTVTSSFGFDQSVELSYRTLPSLSSGTFNDPIVQPNSSTTATITTSLGTPSDFYTVTIEGSGGGKTHSASTLLTVEPIPQTPTYTISISPESRTILPGDASTYTVTLVPIGGFSSSVDLTITNLPDEMTTEFNPNPVTNLATGSSNSILTIQTSDSIQTEFYELTVKAEGGGEIKTQDLILTVTDMPNFELSIYPTLREITASQSTNYEVTVTSLAGFDSPVQLTLSTSASIQTTFNPNPVTSTPDGQTKSTLNIETNTNTNQGDYTLTIVGTSDSLEHMITATLKITSQPDFTVAAQPEVIAMSRGETKTISLEVSSINGFNSEVTFTTESFYKGITLTFTPQAVTVSTSASSTLTVTSSDDAILGTYRFTLKFQSGALEHEVVITVTIEGSQPSLCLIATATYGSEIADEVQILRDFRDNHVLESFAGRQFMSVFNMWYYSFSPAVADSIRLNNMARDVMKVFLYPLISILQITDITFQNLLPEHEFSIIFSGLVASSLIGIVYASPLQMGLERLLSISSRIRARIIKYEALALSMSTLLLIMSELINSEILMMISSGMFVILSIALSSSLTVIGLKHILSKLRQLMK